MPDKLLFLSLMMRPVSGLLRFLAVVTLAATIPIYGQTNIAVLDLESDVSVSDKTVDTICTAISGEIGKDPDFTVFDRQYLPFVFESSGINRDEPCSDIKCLADIGTKIGANQVVGGTIRVVKRRLELKLLRVDTKKSTILQTVSSEMAADKVVFLNEELPVIVKSLLRDEIATTAEPEKEISEEKKNSPGIWIGASTLLAGGVAAVAVYYFHFRDEYTAGTSSPPLEEDMDIPMDDVPERGRE